MSTNPAFDSGDDQNRSTQVVVKRTSGGNTDSDAETSRSPPAYSPNEGTFLAGPQTYFADEKITIPEIDKVRSCVRFFVWEFLDIKRTRFVFWMHQSSDVIDTNVHLSTSITFRIQVFSRSAKLIDLLLIHCYTQSRHTAESAAYFSWSLLAYDKQYAPAFTYFILCIHYGIIIFI